MSISDKHSVLTTEGWKDVGMITSDYILLHGNLRLIAGGVRNSSSMIINDIVFNIEEAIVDKQPDGNQING